MKSEIPGLKKSAKLVGAYFLVILSLFGKPAFAGDLEVSIDSIFDDPQVLEDAENFLPDFDQYRVGHEILDLFKRVNRLGRKLEESLDHDHEAFMELVDKKQVFIEEPGVGIAELNSVDGIKFVRVRHEASKMAFIFLNHKKINRHSKHLRQIEARQHIMARRYANGYAAGRNFVYIWYDGSREKPLESVGEVRYSPKHPKYSPAWWKDYWIAVYKKPSRGDLVLAALSTAVQFGLASGLSGLRLMIGHDSEMNWAPAFLTIPFAFGITLYLSTFLNWKYMSTNFRNTLKSSVISLIFASALVASLHGGLSSLSPIGWSEAGALVVSGAGLFHLFLIVANTVGNNWAKVSIDRFVQIRREMRLNAGSVQLATGAFVKRASLENQALYLVAFTFRMIDVFFPYMGKAFLWSSIPISKAAIIPYAKKIRYEHLKTLENEWDAMKKLYIPQIKSGVRSLLGSCRSSIARLLPASGV